MIHIFTLQVIGARVVYSGAAGEHTFTSFTQAWRYVRRWNAVKIAGGHNQISGAYIITEEM